MASPAKKARDASASSSSDAPFFLVVGGGNSTPIMAALAKTAGYRVGILTRRPQDWSKNVGFVNEDPEYLDGAKELRADVDVVTADPAEVVPLADIVFLAGLPIHHNEVVLGQIAPHLSKEKQVHVGTICAYGGFNWVAAKALGPGKYVLFGTQLIPWTCGTPEGGYGKTGVVFGAKRLLRIATESGKDETNIKGQLAKVLRMPFLTDTDFLACCFWPNNPSLHPPILIGLFEDWDGTTPFDPATLPLFIYKDLRTHSAEFLVWLDRELCFLVGELSKRLPGNANLKLNYSLKHCIIENYTTQVLNQWDTVSCVSSNVAFGKHKIPYTTVPGGVVPTLKHKFFETDLTHGLVMWKDVAIMLGLPDKTPIIDRIIRWNQRLNHKDYLAPDGTLTGKDIGECVVPSRMGITRVEDLVKGFRG